MTKKQENIKLKNITTPTTIAADEKSHNT